MLEFRVLGPLEVADHGRPAPLGSGRQVRLLSCLLLHSNEVVPRDLLIDALWGERAPKTADTALRVQVHALRKLLGQERIDTEGPGYRLHVGPGELDLERFEESVRARAERARLRRSGRSSDDLPRARSPSGAGRRSPTSPTRPFAQSRDRAARRAATRRARRADRGRPRARPPRRARPRARGARVGASRARAPARPADARPVPQRPPDRRRSPSSAGCGRRWTRSWGSSRVPSSRSSSRRSSARTRRCAWSPPSSACAAISRAHRPSSSVAGASSTRSAPSCAAARVSSR